MNQFRNRRWSSLIVLTCLWTGGCQDAGSMQREPPLKTAKSLTPPASEAASTEAAASADPSATTERNYNGAIFQVPAAWKEAPKKSDMIIAEFAVPGPTGDGRLTLSTAGGDVKSNLDRWKGQFGRGPADPAPQESMLTVDGRTASFVELFGSYQGMEPGATRKSGQAMLGVVIPLRLAERETNYFVKLTGPRETLSAVRDTFIRFVESAKFKD